MANDLPQTIDDLTHPELLLFVKECFILRPRPKDLIWLRYSSLLDETHNLEERARQARAAWIDAMSALLSASAAASSAVKNGARAFARADRAYRAASADLDRLEKARDLAERKATRMRARMDAAFQAWQTAGDADIKQAGG